MVKTTLKTFLISSVFFSSCAKEPEVVKRTIAGNYLLTELLADPGNGSGTFTAVSSSKTLTFGTNNSINSNGDICSMGSDANQPSFGTFSLQDSTISVNNCFVIDFELNGNELILSYPCIEPCKAKYTRQLD